jgi:hypothetical protein
MKLRLGRSDRILMESSHAAARRSRPQASKVISRCGFTGSHATQFCQRPLSMPDFRGSGHFIGSNRQRRGHGASYQHEPTKIATQTHSRRWMRDGGEQFAHIVRFGRAEYVVAEALLDNLSGLHDNDAITQQAHHVKVMRDEQITHTQQHL